MTRKIHRTNRKNSKRSNSKRSNSNRKNSKRSNSNRRTNRRNTNRRNTNRRNTNRINSRRNFGGSGSDSQDGAQKVAKQVNFGNVVDNDGRTGDPYMCGLPKQYSNLQGMPGKLSREKVYQMVLKARDGRRPSLEVNAKICGSETPYLTDNGYCCSPTDDGPPTDDVRLTRQPALGYATGNRLVDQWPDEPGR
jgi:hypothetical protein